MNLLLKDLLSFKFLLSGAFLVLIFSLGFMQPFLRVSNFKIPLTDFIFLFVFAFWAAAVLLKKVEFRRGAFYLPLLLYVLALTVSAFFSSATKTSFIKLSGELYLIGLAFLAFNLSRDFSLVKRTIFVWLGASAVACLVGALTVLLFYLDRANILLVYTLHYYGSLPPGNYPRIQSTFLYPSMLCNYLTVSVLMLFAARELDWIGRGFFLTLLALFAFAAAFTITPGLGGVLLGTGIWFCLDFKKNGRLFLSKTCIFAGLAAAISFLLVSTFTLRLIPTSPYFFKLPFANLRIDPTQRLLTWQSAGETFLNHPFFGKGLGLGAARVSFLDPSGNMQFLTDAHQTWLNIAAESGIIGLAGICFICFFFVRRSLPLKLLAQDQTSVLRACFGIAFISAFLYQGLIGSFENARHLWILMGLLASVSESNLSYGANGSEHRLAHFT